MHRGTPHAWGVTFCTFSGPSQICESGTDTTHSPANFEVSRCIGYGPVNSDTRMISARLLNSSHFCICISDKPKGSRATPGNAIKYSTEAMCRHWYTSRFMRQVCHMAVTCPHDMYTRHSPTRPRNTFETSQSWHVAASRQRADFAMYTSQHRVGSVESGKWSIMQAWP